MENEELDLKELEKVTGGAGSQEEALNGILGLLKKMKAQGMSFDQFLAIPAVKQVTNQYPAVLDQLRQMWDAA